MKFPDLSSKNFTKLKFAGFFSTAVLLCVIIFSSFWAPNPSAPQQELTLVEPREASAAGQLLEINQLLHSKWLQLELLYDEHTLSMADLSKASDNLQPGTQIMEAEVSYAKLLDSVSANNAASPDVEKIDSVVNTFRASLQNKQALHHNISELTSKNSSKTIITNVPDNKVPDQKPDQVQNERTAKKLAEMQNELQFKTAMIAKLQNQSKLPQVKSTTDGSRSSADVKKMKDELEFLKWALRSEVSANHALTENVNKLKQTNSGLTNQLKGK